MAGTFDPSSDIPSLEGKVILITGANTGLGKQAALELAKHKPAQIWITARNIEKGDAVFSELKSQAADTSFFLQQLDLTSFDSIRRAAKEFLALATRLDILFLNAGIMGHPAAVTQDGYKIHMGTNHLGHALLLKLLTPLLVKTAIEPPSVDVRVVIMSSVGYKFSNPEGIQFDDLKKARVEGITPVMQYSQSKLTNLLYAQQVAKRYPQFTTVSVHPGSVKTELFSREPGDEQMRHLQTAVAPAKSIAVEEGVKNQLWAATAPTVKSGVYYEPIGVADMATGLARDEEMAQKLWVWTEKELEGINI
ncbi:NAD(P)-binding protein [Biscogniauxia marginata]|nr:NAD(P)-binding protein [Biscogniauxia marginata]